MLRFFLSIFVGLTLGLALGLYLGWVQFPRQYINSPITSLTERFKDEYTVMIAAGYLADGDLGGAFDRLRLLGQSNIPAYVQTVTERYITNSRDARDIAYLVALAEGLGRLTPIMEPYRQLRPLEQQP
ncbi:MAG: hypothetical protein J0L63_03240 [Anaerolineae bacterium]|nr:hypothetical protein [Anaerolineae bacterium]MBN8617891.1 hypothetical protein [Anaerolineae bacterium]